MLLCLALLVSQAHAHTLVIGAEDNEDGTMTVEGVYTTEDWQAIARANPDIIVKYGNPYAIERGLVKALKKYPELSAVPAIKNRAIYTLPAYYNASATQYPSVLRVWLDAVY